MLSLATNPLQLCDGVTRRDWMRVGGLGLGGLTLPGLFAARRAVAEGKRVGALSQPGSETARADLSQTFGRAKSCIILALLGGPPQQDTFDCKPEAPPEIRGPLGTIETSLPGFRIGELLPRTAAYVDRLAILRAMVTNDNAHSSSGYYMLTGHPHLPQNVENARPGAPNNWPVLGALVKKVSKPSPGLPSVVTLPEHIWNTGMIPWPGQDAGFLGRTVDPWLLHCDPSQANFQVPALSFPQEIANDRFSQRRSLLETMNRRLDDLSAAAAVKRFDVDTAQALDLLTSTKSRHAFDLAAEGDALRDRYGRHRWGQSVLLARRLVESGVSLVQVNFTRVTGKLNDGTWDTHGKHVESLKDFLMPMLDASYSALLEDLEQRGLLDETLVVLLGEFGKTPKINGNGGRDHWGSVFSIALAGGGVRPGIIHGTSDGHAAYPVDGRVLPEDLHATIFHLLGHHPHTEFQDHLGRPLPLSRGRVVSQIL